MVGPGWAWPLASSMWMGSRHSATGRAGGGGGAGSASAASSSPSASFFFLRLPLPGCERQGA